MHRPKVYLPWEPEIQFLEPPLLEQLTLFWTEAVPNSFTLSFQHWGCVRAVSKVKRI